MEQLLYLISVLGTRDEIFVDTVCLVEVQSKKPTNVLRWTITFKVFSYFSLYFQ